MEAPPTFRGEDAGSGIRDAKNNVLKAIQPLDPAEVVVGQYVAADGKPGYLDDDSIQDKERAKRVPTFAQVVLRIDNPRWHGVPFIMKAGKALNKRKAEIRVQFKQAPASRQLFGGEEMPRNELVMTLQPTEAVYMKMNVKTPGMSSGVTQSELDLSYDSRFKDIYNPDAYTRLILEALNGNQGNFVRSDELLNSWKLFTPLLEALEKDRVPVPYSYGGRGPSEADEMAHKLGYIHEEGYFWDKPKTAT